MAKTVGIATFAHSDHIDYILPDVNQFTDIKTIRKGVLDGLGPKELQDLTKGKPGEHVLALKLKDGTYVKAAESRVIAGMQKNIDSLNQSEADFIMITCMGQFPELKSKKLLVQPGNYFKEIAVGAAGPEGRLGVMSPLPEQIKGQTESIKKIISNRGWRTQLQVVAGSPYGSDATKEVTEASNQLKKFDPQLIACTCPGYTPEMKKIIESVTGKPALIGRSAMIYIIRSLTS